MRFVGDFEDFKDFFGQDFEDFFFLCFTKVRASTEAGYGPPVSLTVWTGKEKLVPSLIVLTGSAICLLDLDSAEGANNCSADTRSANVKRLRAPALAVSSVNANNNNQIYWIDEIGDLYTHHMNHSAHQPQRVHSKVPRFKSWVVALLST